MPHMLKQEKIGTRRISSQRCPCAMDARSEMVVRDSSEQIVSADKSSAV